MSSFTSPLVVSPLADGRRWYLTEPFDYHVGAYPSDTVIRVPVGFVTDFASIPRGLWAIFPPWGAKYGKPAIIHDYCYETAWECKQRADDVFYEAMGIMGARDWVRRLMWLAVRFFGKGRYK